MRILRKSGLPMGLLATILAGSLACGSSGGGSGAPAAPAFTTQPANLTVTAGSNASFTVAASGSPGPGFIWARSNDGGTTWNAINGATQPTYTFTTQVADNGAQFHAVASNPSGAVTSSPATLTVQGTAGPTAPVITGQPVNASVMPGGTATFTVTASGNPPPTFTWISSTDRGRTWSAAIAGATSPSYTAPAQAGDNGTLFRAVASNPSGSATSNPAGLTVGGSALTTLPAITTQPLNVAITPGASASFTVTANGIPAPSFAWSRSTDGGATWSPITPPATLATYTLANAQLTDNGALFQAVASNSAGKATSNPGTLAVSPAAAPDVYAAGYVADVNGNRVPGYWKNGTWVDLQMPAGAGEAFVNKLVLSGGDVYAAGNAVLADTGVLVAGYWHGFTWNPLPSLDPTQSSAATCMVVSGTDVYVGGKSTQDVDLTVAGFWLNGNWNPLPPADPTADPSSSIVKALELEDGTILAGGSSTGPQGVRIPGGWNNGVWAPLPVINPLFQSSLQDATLTEFGDVYAAGISQADAGTIVPGFWANNTWFELPATNGAAESTVTAIAVEGGDVYVAGGSYDGTTTFAGYWKNGFWIDLLSPDVADTQATAGNSLVLSGSDVYVGGWYQNTTGLYLPGYWLNGEWVGLAPSPATMVNGKVNAMLVVP